MLKIYKLFEHFPEDLGWNMNERVRREGIEWKD